MAGAFGPDVAFVAEGSVFPRRGPSLGQLASAGGGFTVGPGDMSQLARPYGAGHPLVWGAVILLLLFIGAWLVERNFKEAMQFGNLKVSGYNVVVTGVFAVTFIYALKLAGFAVAQRNPGSGFAAWTAGI